MRSAVTTKRSMCGAMTAQRTQKGFYVKGEGQGRAETAGGRAAGEGGAIAAHGDNACGAMRVRSPSAMTANDSPIPAQSLPKGTGLSRQSTTSGWQSYDEQFGREYDGRENNHKHTQVLNLALMNCIATPPAKLSNKPAAKNMAIGNERFMAIIPAPANMCTRPGNKTSA